jgi:uncharacterized membrane protein
MEQSTSLIGTIENTTAIDRVAERVQPPVRAALDANPAVADFLQGAWLGHPLHAALTDVPVGAWTAGLVLDALELRGGQEGRGDAVHAIGLVAALGAAATGLADLSRIDDDKARRVGTLHGMLNTVVAGLFGASLLARARDHRGAGIALSSVGYGILLFSAWLGGELTYRQDGAAQDGAAAGA